MQEKLVKLEGEVHHGNYRAWFRCTNCGVIFQFDMMKGTPAKDMKGICPHCAVRSGSAGVGVFTLVKFNPNADEIIKRYYS